MLRSCRCRWSSISGSERTGWIRSSSASITSRMRLKRRPVRTAQQPGQVKTVEQKGMNDHAYDCQVYDVGKKHQPDAKHDREHCRLIRVRASLDCNIPRYPHG